MTEAETAIPKALTAKRVHSLMGIWLTIFLAEHLLVNSQAAYFFGQDGKGFIKAVNSIHDLPYLPLVEFLILAMPFLIHMVWGIKYALTAKPNSSLNTGITPYLPEYSRNKAYTWQRITSWLLVVGIIAHVIQMRFIEYPTHASVNSHEYYMVLVDLDDGIYTLAERLDVQLYDSKKVQIKKNEFLKEDTHVSKDKVQELLQAQNMEEQSEFLKALEKHQVKVGQAIAVSKDFGTAELLMVRETFKIPIMIALYTLFVLAACFHGFNGLWTALISWGVITSEKSMKLFLKISYGLMFIFSFLGLSAIYATYWINLKQ